MVIQILAGMFIGSAIASLVWWYLIRTEKNKASALDRERDEAMSSIGDLWAQIDKLFSSYQSGAITDTTLQKTLISRLDAIDNILRPNLHLFEVYYVKYIESLMAGYRGKIFAPKSDSGDTILSDVEMETNYSVVEQPRQTNSVEPSNISVLPEPQILPVAEESAADFSPKEPAINVPESSDLSNAVLIGSPKVENDISPEVTLELPPATESIHSESDTSTHTQFEVELKSSPEVVLGEEDFSMETMMDIDINRLSASLKHGDTNSKLQSPKTPEDSQPIGGASVLETKPVASEKIDSNMEIVIASDATHTESTPPAAGDVKKSANTVKGDKRADMSETIPEETTYTPSDKLKAVDGQAKSSSEEADEAEFEAIFEQASTSEPATGKQSQPVASLTPEVDGDDSSETISAEEFFSGDDVAQKIASLETTPYRENKEEKRETGKEQKKAPEPKSSSTAKKSTSKAAPKQVASSTATKRKGDAESITGDDVAEKIDSFFGLFND